MSGYGLPASTSLIQLHRPLPFPTYLNGAHSQLFEHSGLAALAGRPKVGDGTIVVELTYENEKYMLRIVTKARCLTQMRTAKAGEDLISIRKPESIRVVDDVEVVRRSASSLEFTDDTNHWHAKILVPDSGRGGRASGTQRT